VNQQQLINLRKNAKSWTEKHPDIQTIYLVTTNTICKKYPYFDCTLIAIIPEQFQYEAQRKWAGNGAWEGPEDGMWQFVREYMIANTKYQKWAGDGFSHIHVREDMDRIGFKRFQLLTFDNMESAERFYAEMIRPQFHPEDEVKWFNLTDDNLYPSKSNNFDENYNLGEGA
jgi:hypothetical protein